MLKQDSGVPDVLSELMQEMSGDGLFVPETSITIRSIVGEGENMRPAVDTR